MILADLEAIKRRCETASAGPWSGKAYRVYAEPGVDYGSGSTRIVAACWRPWGPVTGDGSIEADAEFIAHAREDVPALLEAVERLLSMLTDAQTEAEMQAAEVGRLRPLDAIVRQTAALTCWEYDSYDGTYQCRFCSKWTEAAAPITDPPKMVNDTHDAECLYALALAYVEANPA